MTVSIGSGSVSASIRASVTTGSAVADRAGRADQPVDLGVDRRGHARVVVAEGGDRDPVREVEVGAAGRVVQAMPLAVAPAPLEVAAEDRREVRRLRGEIGDATVIGLVHRPSIGVSGRTRRGRRSAPASIRADGRLRAHRREPPRPAEPSGRSPRPRSCPHIRRVGRGGRVPARALRADGRAGLPRARRSRRRTAARGWTTSASRSCARSWSGPTPRSGSSRASTSGSTRWPCSSGGPRSSGSAGSCRRRGARSWRRSG